MKDVVKADIYIGIFKGNDFFREFFQQYSIFTWLNLAECKTNRSLKDLVSSIFLIPYFPLTDQLDHQWKSCFVLALFITALFNTLLRSFTLKRQNENKDWGKNLNLCWKTPGLLWGHLYVNHNVYPNCVCVLEWQSMSSGAQLSWATVVNVTDNSCKKRASNVATFFCYFVILCCFKPCFSQSNGTISFFLGVMNWLTVCFILKSSSVHLIKTTIKTWLRDRS